MSISSVALITEDPGLAEAASAAIREAGASPLQAASAAQLALFDPAIDRPKVVICGHDVDQITAATINQSWPDCRVIWAALGDKAWGTSQCLALPESSRQLTHLVESIHRPPGPVKRVALLGAHGGAGTSCLAVALALRLANRGMVRLAGLNWAGAPIESLLGLRDWPGWGDRLGDSQNLALARSQVIQGVETLGGQAPSPQLAAWQMRQTLEAWEAQSGAGYTVLDAGQAAPGGAWRVASWADHRLIVARADPAGAAALAAMAKELTDLGLDFSVAVRTVRGGLGAGEVTHGIGGQVFVIGDERSFVAGLVHGLTPGDRRKGKLAAAAGQLVNWLGQNEPAAAPLKRVRRRTGRRALPSFNPAAFAEEW